MSGARARPRRTCGEARSPAVFRNGKLYPNLGSPQRSVPREGDQLQATTAYLCIRSSRALNGTIPPNVPRKKRNAKSVWRFEFLTDLIPPQWCVFVVLKVWDLDFLKKGDFLGETRLSMQDLAEQVPVDGAHEFTAALQPKSSGTDKFNRLVQGSLRFTCQVSVGD